MAQIRSKQIADFLASVNWSNVSASDIANAADIKSYVDGEISTEHAHHSSEKVELDASINSLELKAGDDLGSIEDRISLDEAALSAEISATNSDVASIDLRVSNEISATGSEVTSLDVRVAADIAALSAEISDTDVDFGSIDTRVSDVEDALTAEIAATNGDVNLINASIDSLEGVDAELSAEFSGNLAGEAATRLAADTALAASVDSLEVKAGADLAELNASVDSLENVDAALSAEIVVEKNRINAILDGSTVDLDQFAEVVAYVDSLDLADDNFLANEIASMNLRDTNLEASVDSLEGTQGSQDTRMTGIEGDLSTEISATDSEVVSLNARVSAEEFLRAQVDGTLANDITLEAEARIAGDLSLTTRLATEEGARAEGDLHLQNSVDSIETQLGNVSGDLVGSVDSLEVALSAEISATNSDVTRIDAALSAEISATNSDVNSIDLRVSQEESLAVFNNDSQDTRMTGIEGDLSAEISATDSEVVSLNIRISNEESLAIAEFGSVDTRASIIEANLSTEIAATNAEVIDINASIDSLEVKAGDDLAELNSSVDSLESVDAALSAEIVTEKGRIDAILAGSTVDLDQFAEVVAYVDSLDLADDNFLTNQIASMNLRDSAIELNIDQVEAALAAEISATDSEVIRLDGRVDSLETKHDAEMSVETAARVLGDTYVEAAVTGVDATAGSVAVNVPTHSFEMGAFDTEVYVNGLRVAFTQDGPQDFTLSVNYPIEATDIIRFVGVGAEVVA